jgi:hypothetical protein
VFLIVLPFITLREIGYISFMRYQMDENKRNLLYFENASMRGLHDDMNKWQSENRKRLLSVSIQRDGDLFCCVALTNPTEVVICGPGGDMAKVSTDGCLWTI